MHPDKVKEINKRRASIKCEWMKQYIIKNTNCPKRKEWHLKASKLYRENNRSYYTAYAAKRRFRQKQAMPKWANEVAMYNIYVEARNQQLEVDHVIPLKHPLVCGLHWEGNMQLLSRSDNASKSNKFDITALILEEEEVNG